MGRKPLLTKEQVLEAIHRWIVSHGDPPTIEELRRALDVGSSRTALRYLAPREQAGDIRRRSGARGVQPLRAPKGGLATVPVPIAGEVPAGPLMLAEQNVEGWVRLPKEFVR